MNLEKQTISSPYYPQNFLPDGIVCEWVITAPEGHIIALEFVHFYVSENRIRNRNIYQMQFFTF